MSKMSKAIAVLGVVAGLGVAALPLSSYAADEPYSQSTSADVQVGVSGAISIEVDNGATDADAAKNLVDLGQIKLNGDIVSKGLKVTVKTNAGVQSDVAYSLTMTTESANNALMNENGIELPAGVPQQGTSAWGYAVGTSLTDATTDLTGWAAVPGKGSTPAELKANGNVPSATHSEDTFVHFGATASTGQKEGIYKGTVVFTATVQ